MMTGSTAKQRTTRVQSFTGPGYGADSSASALPEEARAATFWDEVCFA